MPSNRDPEERQDGCGYQSGPPRIARGAQPARAIGEDVSDIDIGGRLLRHPRERRQDEFLRLALDHFDRRRARNPLLRDNTREHRGLENTEPDIESYPDHDDAEQERDAPTPG